MMRTVAICGVGLIGGSFALALRKAGFDGRIVGVSSDKTLEKARALGVIDEGLRLGDAVGAADLVYLAQPVSVIIGCMAEVAAHLKPGTLVTDAGSTKAAIVAAAGEHFPRGAFLGGHPMAGKAERGVTVAEAGLFEGRPYLITPRQAEDLESGGARSLLEWVGRIGARVLVMAPERHDRVVGASSHLPQLASTALAALLADLPESSLVRSAAGPGLHDMTRLALSEEGLWRDILATNCTEVARLLEAYENRLAELRRAVELGQAAQWFERGAKFARQLRG
jgi:prephenate dehydrogenase